MFSLVRAEKLVPYTKATLASDHCSAASRDINYFNSHVLMSKEKKKKKWKFQRTKVTKSNGKSSKNSSRGKCLRRKGDRPP